MKICKIKECKDKHYARGWCSKHYRRWERHRDPLFTENHGYSNHTLYGIWLNMKKRCYNKNYEYYKNYGGRGITVCKEWKSSAKTFIEWALPLWKEDLEIDRINNNANYCSENCRFITHTENMHNTKLLRSSNTSGYRGVSYFKRDENWRSYITINNKRKHLGYFDSSREAALAYDNAVIDNRPKNFERKRI